jgi:hypothetical protein
VTFALGIFDLFAYSIPGFLYIGFLGFFAYRVDWIALHLKDVKDVPSLLIVIVLAVSAYIIGHVTWPLGRYVDNLSYRWWPAADATKVIVERDPSAAKSGYLQYSRFLLQARVEMTNREVASEISRLRAAGLMLRNCIPPLLLAFLYALVELAIGERRLMAGALAVLFLLAALGATTQSRTMQLWSILKTYELSYWDFAAGEPNAKGIPPAASPARKPSNSAQP